MKNGAPGSHGGTVDIESTAHTQVLSDPLIGVRLRTGTGKVEIGQSNRILFRICWRSETRGRQTILLGEEVMQDLVGGLVVSGRVGTRLPRRYAREKPAVKKGIVIKSANSPCHGGKFPLRR